MSVPLTLWRALHNILQSLVLLATELSVSSRPLLLCSRMYEQCNYWIASDRLETAGCLGNCAARRRLMTSTWRNLTPFPEIGCTILYLLPEAAWAANREGEKQRMEAATSAGEIEKEQEGLNRPKGLKLNNESKSSHSPGEPGLICIFA